MQGLVTPSLVPGLLTQSAEGQPGSGQEGHGGWSLCVGHLTGSVWRGVAGLLGWHLHWHVLIPARVSTPAASAGSESPICKRAGGSSTCSVDVLVCEAVVMGLVVLLCGDGCIGRLNL